MEKRLKNVLTVLVFGCVMASFGFMLAKNADKKKTAEIEKSGSSQQIHAVRKPDMQRLLTLSVAANKAVRNTENPCPIYDETNPKECIGYAFYRDTDNPEKIMTGIGIPVLKNTRNLNTIAIYKLNRKDPLTTVQRFEFFSIMHKLSDKELQTYYITPSSAENYLENDIFKSIDNLSLAFEEDFAQNQNNESNFFNIPISMQLVALDIDRELGNIKKRPEFLQAIEAKSFIEAKSQCCTDPMNPENIKRNFRRLLYLTADELSEKESAFSLNHLKTDFNQPHPIFEEISNQLHRNACWESTKYKAKQSEKSVFSYKSMAELKQEIDGYCLGTGEANRLSEKELAKNTNCLAVLLAVKETPKKIYTLTDSLPLQHARERE